MIKKDEDNLVTPGNISMMRSRMSPCWTTFSQLRIYTTLFVATTFVNKYVLSILEFKYPTIFQGWQTLVGFIVMKMLVATRYLKPMLSEGNPRSDIIRWIPAMIGFVVSIYSGSKGLAELSVPVFLAVHNITIFFDYLSQMIIYRKLTSAINYLMCMVITLSSFQLLSAINYLMCMLTSAINYLMCMLTSAINYLMCMVITLSSFGIVITDPQHHQGGYFWVCIHILSTGFIMFYTNMTRGRLKISAVEKLYCNYIYSVIILAPTSYLLGDALEAVKYPYLYFSKFYVGCCASGVFGVLLNLYSIRLQENASEGIIEYSRINGLVKIFTSIISLAVFNTTLTAEHVACLLVNHLAALACEDMSDDQTTHKTANHSEGQKEIKVQHNVLYNDYLKEKDDDYVM